MSEAGSRDNLEGIDETVCTGTVLVHATDPESNLNHQDGLAALSRHSQYDRIAGEEKWKEGEEEDKNKDKDKVKSAFSGDFWLNALDWARSEVAVRPIASPASATNASVTVGEKEWQRDEWDTSGYCAVRDTFSAVMLASITSKGGFEQPLSSKPPFESKPLIESLTHRTQQAAAGKSASLSSTSTAAQRLERTAHEKNWSSRLALRPPGSNRSIATVQSVRGMQSAQQSRVATGQRQHGVIETKQQIEAAPTLSDGQKLPISLSQHLKLTKLVSEKLARNTAAMPEDRDREVSSITLCSLTTQSPPNHHPLTTHSPLTQVSPVTRFWNSIFSHDSSRDRADSILSLDSSIHSVGSTHLTPGLWNRNSAHHDCLESKGPFQPSFSSSQHCVPVPGFHRVEMGMGDSVDNPSQCLNPVSGNMLIRDAKLQILTQGKTMPPSDVDQGGCRTVPPVVVQGEVRVCDETTGRNSVACATQNFISPVRGNHAGQVSSKSLQTSSSATRDEGSEKKKKTSAKSDEGSEKKTSAKSDEGSEKKKKTSAESDEGSEKKKTSAESEEGSEKKKKKTSAESDEGSEKKKTSAKSDEGGSEKKKKKKKKTKKVEGVEGEGGR